jgi:hypothetical protein
MRDYLIAMLAFPLLSLGWFATHQLARRFAERHPEFGEPPAEGSGCGQSCRCGGASSCRRTAADPSPPLDETVL